MNFLKHKFARLTVISVFKSVLIEDLVDFQTRMESLLIEQPSDELLLTS
jgi:hypothetical protein